MTEENKSWLSRMIGSKDATRTRPQSYEPRTSALRELLVRHRISYAAVAKEADRGNSTARDAILTGGKSPAIAAAIARLLTAKGEPITASDVENILTGMRDRLANQ